MHSNAMRYHRFNGRMFEWRQTPAWDGADFVLDHMDQRIFAMVEERSNGCFWNVKIVSAGLVQAREGAESGVIGAQCAVARAVDEFLSIGWLLTC